MSTVSEVQGLVILGQVTNSNIVMYGGIGALGLLSVVMITFIKRKKKSLMASIVNK